MISPPSLSFDQKLPLLPERFLFGSCLVLLFVGLVLAGTVYEAELLLMIYHGGARFDVFWKIVTAIGSQWTLIPIVGAVGFILASRRQPDAAIWLVFGWAATTLTVDLLKWLIARERPPVPPLTTFHGASFPSGHAAESLFVFFYLWIILARSPLRVGAAARLRDLCSILLAALPALVGYSRVFLGVHWPSDVLAGWAIGFFILGIAFLGAPPALPVTPASADDMASGPPASQ